MAFLDSNNYDFQYSNIVYNSFFKKLDEGGENITFSNQIVSLFFPKETINCNTLSIFSVSKIRPSLSMMQGKRNDITICINNNSSFELFYHFSLLKVSHTCFSHIIHYIVMNMIASLGMRKE